MRIPLLLVTLLVAWSAPVFAQQDRPREPFRRRAADGPPPQALNAPVRIKQALVPGAAYETRIKGTMNFDGVDERMGPLLRVTGTIRISYAFEATIERTIIENDGSRIVEDRHFKELRVVEVGTDAQNFEMKPGPTGQFLLNVLPFIPSGGQVRLALTLLEKIANQAGVLDQFGKMAAKGYKFAAVAQVDQLQGKIVRLTYVDGRGVTELRAVKGEITDDERDFHMNSVVVSDCLMFPDVNVPVGGRYRVPGSNFGSVIDPSLLSHLEGEVGIRRSPDAVPPGREASGKRCVALDVFDGELKFRSGTRVDGDQYGVFRPTGTLYYDTAQQLIVEARLSGSGELTRIPTRNLLRTVKQFGTPKLEIVYTSRRIGDDAPRPPVGGSDLPPPPE